MVQAEAQAGPLDRELGPADFRELVEPLVDAMFVIDMTARRYVYANEAMAKLRGSTEPNAGLDTGSIWAPDALAFLERVTPARVNAFLAGENHRYVDELAMLRVDGSAVWTEAHSFMVKDPKSGHLLVCGKLKPVRHQDRLDLELGGERRLIDEIQESASIGVWTIDPYRGQGRWSEEVSKVHELPPSADVNALMGQLDPASLELLTAGQARGMVTGEPFVHEVRITTSSGNRKWVRVAGRAIFEHGVAVRIRGTTQDITARKEFELRLEDERAALQSLLDHLPDVVALKDLEGRVLACNARVEQVFGVGRGELIGRTLQQDAPADAQKFDHRDKNRDVHQSVRGEDWLTFADGHRELCETITGPVRNPKGEVVGTLRIARDVTAQRAAEDQLRAAQRMEAIGRLAGGVAHDFNNLLSVIISYAQLAADALERSHPIQEDLAEIRSASKRAEALTRQLLAFSRRQLLQYTPLRLDEVVDTIGNMLRRLIGEDVLLEHTRTNDLFTTMADRGQIEQVVMNLVVNARDAMPGGGKITIATRNVTLDRTRAARLELEPGEYVELSVEDTGTGIEPAALSRVFEPFFTTKDVGKGTGLGLSMVYGIVKQTGGGVSVSSVPEEGTLFSIFLPRFDAPCEAAPKSAKRETARGTETILIVEDEAGLRAVAKRVVARAGYDVLVAANAEEAVRIAQSEGRRIDLVFTDVIMPGINGGELIERLMPLCPRMKVIFTSGYTDEKLAENGVGGHTVLAKPYEPSQVTETIRRVLDSTTN